VQADYGLLKISDGDDKGIYIIATLIIILTLYINKHSESQPVNPVGFPLTG